MRVEDLSHNELIELDADGGLIRFAGHRALLLDAVAMGVLRQYLVENFGLAAARAVLTQFGFAHGWRMAEATKNQFRWDSDDDWRLAGPKLCTLEGLFLTLDEQTDPLSEQGAMLLASYEAEQHLLHLGQADSAVCWTICGLMSGYLSHTVGKEIFVLEDRCLGQGDASCHLVGRTREEWGDTHADEMKYFETGRLEECLDVSLVRVIDSLKAAEKKLQSKRRALDVVTRDLEAPLGVVARSKNMQVVVDLARRIAKVDATVLITGESGVGKERIAQLVHQESPRALGPFIAVNCGAITETLLESELFGHARGAFTGAVASRPGLFEAASGGTLFLDEIGEVSQSMQVKLLRVLQEREIRRIGESQTRAVNVRILAATNRDLVQEVTDGRFRQDLFYRLKVVELHVPPLRERHHDILPLGRLLLAEAALRMNRGITGLSPAAADQLLRHDWPGNVRELENAMERAVALASGNRVELADLPEDIRHTLPKPIASVGNVQSLEDVERDYILAVLKINRGNQTQTAKQLGIGTATLYRKLKKYRLSTES